VLLIVSSRGTVLVLVGASLNWLLIANLAIPNPNTNPHQPRYSNLTVPKTPAYNTSQGQADKTMHVAELPPIDMEMAFWIDSHFRDRCMVLMFEQMVSTRVIGSYACWG
jgi:hypothetical protein